MMRSWAWGCPSSALPTLHALKFSCAVIYLYYTVDLAVWVGMVLSRKLFYAIHEYCCDAEERRMS